MRKATSVGALPGDIVANPNPNQSNVIALNMSFDYPEPQKAQEVLQNFAQSFLRMDSDVTEDQASFTVRFLEDQAQKLLSQIQQIESEITALKSRNGSVLSGTGIPTMMDTGSYSAQIVSLENENRQLLCRLGDLLRGIKRSRLPKQTLQRSALFMPKTIPMWSRRARS